MELSREQQLAVQELIKLSKQVQTMGGYAGTGKTSVIKTLVKELRGFSVCAFTGKAANVLRQKGVNASTIHSLIYIPEQETYWSKRDCRYYTRTVFSLGNREDIDVDGIIVDEASMVSEEIYNDLCSLDVPLIFVGDHGQLEPVKDKFNLMEEPDIVLETIHRNAGEIARFAEFVRNGNRPADWTKHSNGDQVQFKTLEYALGTVDDTVKYDQIICAFNKTRVCMNRTIREELGRTNEMPQVGDRVMCLQNNRELGLFNGQQGLVGDVSLHNSRLRFDTDANKVWIGYVPEQFNRAQAAKYVRDKTTVPFDYAYAATCHKCQGSEWNDVLVMEQRCDLWDHKRWAYTAASRAKKSLVWVEG